MIGKLIPKIGTFEKGVNTLIFPAEGYIVSLLFFYKDDFGNKEIKLTKRDSKKHKFI